MDQELDKKCDIHEDRFGCPDSVIDLVEGCYGLIVHDGGNSIIEISFCPWCGSPLPPECDPDPNFGWAVGITQERIRQIEAKALRILRSRKRAGRVKIRPVG